MCRIRRPPAGPATEGDAGRDPLAPVQRRSDLVAVRRVRDRLDREPGRPLDVEALARAEGLSPGHLNTQFRLAYGVSPASYVAARRVEMARRRRTREHLGAAARLAQAEHEHQASVRRGSRQIMPGPGELVGEEVAVVAPAEDLEAGA